MKAVSNDFRPALRGIRQLTGIVEYEADGNSFILTTEESDEILTEIGDLLNTEQSKMPINANSIKLINPIFDVDLFKSVCKGLTIESKIKIPLKTKIDAKIGVLVGNQYEYVEYKNYIVNDITYKADTKSYLINAYDKMIESMISYDDDPLNITFPITIRNFILKICEKLDWDYNFGTFINESKTIDKDLYLGQNLTYRDILDDLSQVICGNLIFDESGVLTVKYISSYSNTTLIPFVVDEDVILNVSSVDEANIITDSDLKDRDVNIGQKYGPVNALTISDNNVVLNNLVDSSSIGENGKTEFNIDGNRILINDSDTFITDMFNFMNGLKYYIYDVESIGLLNFEPLDIFLINHSGQYYDCLMLYDDIKLTTGLTESTHADEPTINKSEYIANDVKDKKINNAIISIDKANAKIELNTEAINDANAQILINSDSIDEANAQIVLKANASGRLVQARLDANASSGSSFDVKADNINFNGKTFNLTTENLAINSTKFSVDSNGNMTCSNATVTGGNINIQSDNSNPKIKATGVSYGGANATNEITADGFLVECDNQECLSMAVHKIESINPYGVGYMGDIRVNSSLNNTFTWIYSGFVGVGDNGRYPNAAMYEDGEIHATTYTGGSLDSIKKNIEKYDGALKIVAQADIYSYNLKTEENKDKKHIGLVIGDNKKSYNTPDILISKRGDGIDLYSMISVAWQAIKEQQQIIEKMQEEIEKLKGGIK